MATSESSKDTNPRRKTFFGVVVGTRMKDTATVAVSRFVQHPKYKKYVKRVKRYNVDDKGNTAVVGDKVRIEECRPLSKTKRFRLLSN